jgi:DNA-binding IscR family transcriptional regulator
MILSDLDIDRARFSVEWVSAAESIRFIQVIKNFDNCISDLGAFGEKEGLDPETIQHQLKAAMMAVDSKMLRMAFARQAKQIKEQGSYSVFPSKEKLLETFVREKTIYETLLYLKQKERSVQELAGLLGIPEDQVMAFTETLKKKNLWEGELIET